MSSQLPNLLNPFRPPIDTLRHYNARKLRRDLVAGLTVAVVEVPQAMAYAIIAGVPPVYGIYTSILQGIIGALLSSSEHMTTGPTNTQSLLIASAVKGAVLVGAPPAIYLDLVFTLTIFKGLIQLCCSAAGLGDLVRYVSRSVILGLTAGAGVLILVGQLPAFLGIESGGAQSALPGIIGRLHQLFQQLGQMNPRATAIGFGVLAVVVGVRFVSRLLPGTLLAVVLAAVTVAAMGWSAADIPLIEPLPEGLPTPYVPVEGIAYARALFGGALALAILGMMESVAIAKSIASHTDERISANQEFFAQGFVNTITGFFQCIPGSGSFTRSALDHAAGAETRFAAVFNGLFVAVIFLLLGEQAKFIPTAALAGVLFVIAVGLFDWRHMLRISRTSRSDAAVLFATFFSTLIAPLEYAIFIGIFLNLALYLRRASQLQMTEMVQDEDRPGVFEEIPLQDRSGEKQVLFLQVEGQLFFGVADELEERLNRLTRSPVKVFIFRLKRTHSIDSTVLGVLDRFARNVRSRGGHVLLCGLRPELLRVIRSYGLAETIGEENLFQTSGSLFTSARMALMRARTLIGHSIDESDVREIDQEGLTYQI